jgi:RNA polymerase sigma-B factor
METARTGKAAELEKALAAYRQSRQEEDLAKLVEAGRKLVYHYLRLYSSGHNEDMAQAGVEGLLKAVGRFDEKVGVSFATYASHCIMGEMRHHIRKEARYYRPGCVADLQRRVSCYIEGKLKESGEPPPLGEIARALNVREDGVVEAMRAGLVSLDEVELSRIKNIRYETFRLPIEDRIFLEQAINRLSELQQKVISLLFFRDMTQDQAARKLGLSQRKVSRILHKSLEEMAAGTDEEREKNGRGS